MSHWICCNACFRPPSADRELALTTCGHVVCCFCYQKGKRDKCLVCSSSCQVSPLNNKSSADVKALFSDINSVATKHLTELSKVIFFQARHQKRLLNHYQQRNEKLEEMLVKMKQEMQQMTKKINEQGAYIVELQQPSLQHQSVRCSAESLMDHVSHNPHVHKAVQIPHSSPMERHTSTTNVQQNSAGLMKHADIMGVDGRSLFRKPYAHGRPALISPPKNARLGSVGYRSSHQNTLSNNSARSATVSRCPGAPVTPDVSYSLCFGWKSPIFRPSPAFRHSMSSLVQPPP